jgi:hypothetical protein
VLLSENLLALIYKFDHISLAQGVGLWDLSWPDQI